MTEDIQGPSSQARVDLSITKKQQLLLALPEVRKFALQHGVGLALSWVKSPIPVAELGISAKGR